MTAHVLFFSVLRDLTGQEECRMELPEGASVSDLLVMLYARWPELAKWDQSLLFAINHSYVKRSASIPANAEVAIMPPVQGG